MNLRGSLIPLELCKINTETMWFLKSYKFSGIFENFVGSPFSKPFLTLPPPPPLVKGGTEDFWISKPVVGEPQMNNLGGTRLQGPEWKAQEGGGRFSVQNPWKSIHSWRQEAAPKCSEHKPYYVPNCTCTILYHPTPVRDMPLTAPNIFWKYTQPKWCS